MKRNPFLLRTAVAAALITAAAAPRLAFAHFIWIVVENGQARVALLEDPSEAPNAKFASYVEKVAVRTSAGKPVTATLTGGARTAAFTTQGSALLTDSTIGVKERGGEVYLLQYHAKGVTNLKDAWTPTKAATEVLARRVDAKTVEVQVRSDGWLVPGTEVYAHVPGSETPLTGTTDLAGTVRFEIPASGLPAGFIGIRANIVDGTTGTYEGKTYAATHHWTTLTFPAAGATNTSVAQQSK